VVKPTQITASDRWSIDLYPFKVNPRYTEEGRPSAMSTPTRRFPISHSLGSDATNSGTRLSGGSNPTSPDSHSIPRVVSPETQPKRVAKKIPPRFRRYQAYRSHSRQALGTFNSLNQHNATRSRPNPLLLPHERVILTNLWFQQEYPISREQWVITRLVPCP
jgi:hypothetical protein